MVEWEAVHRTSPTDDRSQQGAAVVVFAKCSLCTLLSADRSLVRGPFVLLGTFNDNWGMLATGIEGTIHQMQSITNM